MKALALLVFLGLVGSAHAQGAPPQMFEPYTVSQYDHQQLMNALGEIPAKYANPVILQLVQMEQRAHRLKETQHKLPEGKEPKPAK